MKPSRLVPTKTDAFTSEPSGCRLTVKLRGRTTTPDKHRGRTVSSRVHGAKPQSHHGPLQRLLDGMELMLNAPCLALPRRRDGIAPSPPPARQIGNVTNRRV